jgi:imidazolonepropionase-like amidohydrolase
MMTVRSLGMLCGVASLALLLPATGIAQQSDSAALALTHVTVIDGTGSAPVPDMTVVLRRGRIEAIYPSADQRLPEGSRVLDLSGKTVIPGLVESHTHLRAFYASREQLLSELERYVYGGVVALREMAGDARVSAQLNRAARLGEITSPDVYFSAVMMGPHFYQTDAAGVAAIVQAAGPRDPAWAQVVTSETDLPLAVARAAGTGATGLKLYIEMEPELVKAVTDEAHRQGLKVWAHPAVFPSRPLEVVEAGVDGISHVCGLPWQDARLEPRRFAVVSRTNRPTFDSATVQSNSPELKQLFAAMVQRGTFFDPTFSMYPNGSLARFGCDAGLMTRIAREARSAGVTFLTGTDWHAPPGEDYPSLHQEIIALVEHDILSPLEAITAATLNGARALGVDDDTGSIEPGKAANLVVLDNNPVRDIRAISSVFATILRGKPFYREEFRRPD